MTLNDSLKDVIAILFVQVQNEVLGRKPTVKAEMIKISERWIKKQFYMGPEPLFAKTVI
jgi:hypothetical protein